MFTLKKNYFLVLASIAILTAAGFATGQGTVREIDVTKADVCSEKYRDDTDFGFEHRRFQQTEKVTYYRYRNILEKCPNSQGRYDIENKSRALEEEMGERSFLIAMYYFRLFLETGRGGNGAKSRLKEIVVKMPTYSRVSEATVWLAEIERLLAGQP